MTVYVDPLLQHGWVLRGRVVASCHLFADTLDELHAVAARVGMKRTWFQRKDFFPHYDLVASRRAAAVLAGAVEVDRFEASRYSALLRAAHFRATGDEATARLNDDWVAKIDRLRARRTQEAPRG